MVYFIAATVIGVALVAWYLWASRDGGWQPDGSWRDENGPIDATSDAGAYAEALQFEPWASARQSDGIYVRGVSHGGDNA